MWSVAVLSLLFLVLRFSDWSWQVLGLLLLQSRVILHCPATAGAAICKRYRRGRYNPWGRWGGNICFWWSELMDGICGRAMLV